MTNSPSQKIGTGILRALDKSKQAIAIPILLSMLGGSLPAMAGRERREDRRTQEIPQEVEKSFIPRAELAARMSEDLVESEVHTFLNWDASFHNGVIDLYVKNRIPLPVKQAKGNGIDPNEVDNVYTLVTSPLLDYTRAAGAGYPEYIIGQDIAHMERNGAGLDIQYGMFMGELKAEEARLNGMYQESIMKLKRLMNYYIC